MIIHKINPVDAIELYNLDSTDFTWHNFEDPVIKTYLTDRDARLCEVTVKHVTVKHLPTEGKALGGGSINTKQIPGYYVRKLPMLYVNYFDAELEFMRKLQYGVTNFAMPLGVTII